MEKILKELVKDNNLVYSKIVSFIEHDNTGRTNYDIYVNGKAFTVVDAVPLEGGALIKGIKLSTSDKNYAIPVIGSTGIIIFTNKYDAYVVQLADKAYVRSEITDRNGNSTIQEIKVVNSKSIYNMDADEISFKTTNGGEFIFVNDNVTIGNVARIRLQVHGDNDKVQQEVILDKDKGISIISYIGTPITIKNNVGSLKDILNNLIDSFNTANYLSTGGSAVVDPVSVAKLNAIKLKVSKLLN